MVQKNSTEFIKETFILVGIGVLSLIVLNWATGIFNGTKSTNTIVQVQPSQYPDYEAIKGENPDTKLIQKNLTDICPKGGCVNNKSAVVDFGGIDKKYEVKGKFSRAYLYIEAMVDYKRPLTSWDDFYFIMNGMGGHLVSDDSNSLSVPPSEDSKYLYDLRSVSYFSSPTDKVEKVNEHKNINLFNLLQDSAELNIHISLSSARPGRVMKEVSIYYECEDGSDCSIK